MTDNTIIDTTQHNSPEEIMALTQRVADATRALVGAAIMQLQGKDYIKVEGWQALAAAHGCTVTADNVKEIEGGITAIATVRRLRDGAALGNAEGYVGNDEIWGKRPMYARRAMAQTRAISRACRNAFAHVVVAMNAKHKTNYSTTPAEEVPAEGFKPEKVTSTGESRSKLPVWTDEQKNEAGGYRTSIIAIAGVSGERRFADLWTKMKYDPPADVIDALAKLKMDLEEASGGAA